MILSFNSVSNIMDNPFDLEQKNKIKEKQNHRFDFFFFLCNKTKVYQSSFNDYVNYVTISSH